MAAPIVVQAKTASYAGTNTATVVLDAAPTPGNLLVTTHHGQSVLNVTLLAGWTRRAGPVNPTIVVHSRIAQAGDGTSYTWLLGAAGNADVTMLEISGQSSDTFLGLSDEVIGPAGFTQSAPVAAPAPDSLLIVAIRSNQAASAFTLTSPGWTTHNQGQAGGSINFVGCYSRPFVVPDTQSAVIFSTTLSSNVRYTSFAIPGSPVVRAMVGQTAVETLWKGLPALQVGGLVLETINRGAGPVKVGGLAVETVYRGAGPAKVGQAVIEVLHTGTLTVGSPSVAGSKKLPPQVI